LGRIAKHNWEELLEEYLKSEYQNKTDFAKAKGINPSLLRRNSVDWPSKSAGKGVKVSKKNSSNVTKKDVTKESNTKTQKNKNRVTEKVTKKVIQKGDKKAPKKNKSQIKDYLAVVTKNQTEELTEKELLFCFYFVNVHQFNATQSYLKAFECAYSTANVEGCKLLVKPRIRSEIERLKKIKYQSIMVQAEDLIEKHMKIAFASITDFARFGQTEVPIISGGKVLMIPRKVINGRTGKEEIRPEPATRVVNDLCFKESSEVDGSLIKSIKVGAQGSSIELYDSQKSMEWLERYFMWNPMDKHKVAFDNAKLKLEEEKVKIQQEELKLAQRKAGDDDEEDTTDDGFIDALNAEAPSVWSDNDEG